MFASQFVYASLLLNNEFDRTLLVCVCVCVFFGCCCNLQRWVVSMHVCL